MSGETEQEVSGWTVDTLHSHVQIQFGLMRNLLDERYQTQTKATDAAFVAQQTAMKVAFDSAEKAVATALLSAEKAVAKAETAAEKRFDSQNEFRAQLADQAMTFMPRTEGEIRIERASEKINDLTARFNKAEARDQGGEAKAAISRVIGIAVATMAISLIGIVIAILIAVLL